MQIDPVTGNIRMIPYGGNLDVIIGFLQRHGSSVLLNWGEDDNLWECSVISSGDRYSGFSNRDALTAARDCLKKLTDQAPSYDN